MSDIPVIAGAGNNYASGGFTYLKLLQRLRQECAVTGTDPQSVANLTGDMARLANWIKTAWLDIQSSQTDWLFMRQPVSFFAQAGKSSYTSAEMNIASYANMKLDSFRCYTSGMPTDEQELFWLPYDNFRDMYLFGANRTLTQRPVVFTLDPQKNLLLGPIPNGAYNINGECYAVPQEFEAGDDRPAMPPQFHLVIVYRAMMYYGQWESAPEVYQHGMSEYNKLYARLCADQLPKITFGPPLA